MTRSLLATLAVLLTAGAAHAAPITFFGQDPGPVPPADPENTRVSPTTASNAARAQFSNKLSPGTWTTETLDGGLSNGQASVTFALPGPINVTVSGGTSTALNIAPGATDNFGSYPISGTGLWAGDSTFEMTMTAPVTALGFYGVDVGDTGALLSIGIWKDATLLHSFPVAGGTTGNVLYFGVVTDPADAFNKVVFGQTLPSGVTGDRFAFDDFTVGLAATDAQLAPTPEPGTLLLLGSTLAGVGMAAKRRRAARSAK
jgi:hypothetical protein